MLGSRGRKARGRRTRGSRNGSRQGECWRGARRPEHHQENAGPAQGVDPDTCWRGARSHSAALRVHWTRHGEPQGCGSQAQGAPLPFGRHLRDSESPRRTRRAVSVTATTALIAALIWPVNNHPSGRWGALHAVNQPNKRWNLGECAFCWRKVKNARGKLFMPARLIGGMGLPCRLVDQTVPEAWKSCALEPRNQSSESHSATPLRRQPDCPASGRSEPRNRHTAAAMSMHRHSGPGSGRLSARGRFGRLSHSTGPGTQDWTARP